MGSCGSKVKIGTAWVNAGVPISAAKPQQGPEVEAMLANITGLHEQLVACEESRAALIAVTQRVHNQKDATKEFREANTSGTNEAMLVCQNVAAESTKLLLEFRNRSTQLAEAVTDLIFRLMPAPHGAITGPMALQEYIPIIQGHLKSDPVQRFIFPTVCRGLSTLLLSDIERAQKPQLMNDISIFRRTIIRCPLPENHPLRHEKVDTGNLALWMGCPMAGIAQCVTFLNTKCVNPGAILALNGLTNAVIASVDNENIRIGTPDAPAPQAQLVMTAMLICACDAKERALDTQSNVMGSYFVQTVSRFGNDGVTALRVIKCCCINGSTSDCVRVQELLQEV